VVDDPVTSEHAPTRFLGSLPPMGATAHRLRIARLDCLLGG
jgi:hypothetical protein